MFLKIWQNSQEKICFEVSFLIKFAGLKLAYLLKKDKNQVFSCETCNIFNNTYFEEKQIAVSVRKKEFYINHIIYRFLVHFAPSTVLTFDLCRF